MTGLLIIGHGTKSAIGVEQFLTLARRIAHQLAPLPVEPAFLELEQPDIDTAIGCLLESGITRLVTLPLLLFAANHAKQDIPRAVQSALAKRNAQHIEHLQTSHLGLHPSLLHLSHLRTTEVISQLPTPALVPRLLPGNALTGGSCLLESGDGNPTQFWHGDAKNGKSPGPTCDLPSSASDLGPWTLDCLLLVGRGSHDPSATAEMHQFAELRRRDLPNSKVEVAFLAMARPLLHEQLATLACHGYRQIIVQPHLLFHGELAESIRAQVADVAQQYPHTQWLLTPLLADPPGAVTWATELIEKVILDRCLERGIRVVGGRTDD